jgi:hypothetical protein
MKSAPMTIGGSRYSGLGSPPFFAVRYLDDLSPIASHAKVPMITPIPKSKSRNTSRTAVKTILPAEHRLEGCEAQVEIAVHNRSVK